MADAFNIVFTHMATTGSADDACEYIKNRNVRLLFLSRITAHEVSSTIKGIKNSTSCDVDGIQIRPIKEAYDIIAPILAHIFNVCLTKFGLLVNKHAEKVTMPYKRVIEMI